MMTICFVGTTEQEYTFGGAMILVQTGSGHLRRSRLDEKHRLEQNIETATRVMVNVVQVHDPSDKELMLDRRNSELNKTLSDPVFEKIQTVRRSGYTHGQGCFEQAEKYLVAVLERKMTLETYESILTSPLKKLRAEWNKEYDAQQQAVGAHSS